MRDAGLQEAIRAAGGISALARMLGIAQPSISVWSRVPAERVLAVETATAVSRTILRPDLYPGEAEVVLDPVDRARINLYLLLARLILVVPDERLLIDLRQVGGDESALGRALRDLAHEADVLRIDAIVRAFAQVRQQIPQARLHLLGGGSQDGLLRALVNELSLQNSVQLHGRLHDAGMAAVLARCKLSISAPESDATSVSVLESMACGLAVIASDLPANRAWLAPDALVPVGDVDALAARWLALLRDDARAAALGARNAERIAREGDRRVQMDAMDAAYRRLLAEARR